MTIPSVDDKYAQRSSRAEGDCTTTGRIGMMPATLCSSEARVCTDFLTIPAQASEKGVFSRALDSLLRAYGSLDRFRFGTYDAGACSKANAEHLRGRGIHDLLGLEGTQPEHLYWASLSFNDRNIVA